MKIARINKTLSQCQLILEHFCVLGTFIELDKAGELRQDRGQMYIPTQEERYSKVAWYTLLMCLVLPSGVVAWAYGDFSDLMWCLFAFTLPLAHLLHAVGIAFTASVVFSSLLHALGFYWVTKRCKWKPKSKLTLVVTWGMFTALVLRLMVAYTLWQSIVGQGR